MAVVFDESKSWKWSHIERDSGESFSTFKHSIGEFGNNGLREDQGRVEQRVERENNTT